MSHSKKESSYTYKSELDLDKMKDIKLKNHAEDLPTLENKNHADLLNITKYVRSLGEKVKK